MWLLKKDQLSMLRKCIDAYIATNGVFRVAMPVSIANLLKGNVRPGIEIMPLFSNHNDLDADLSFSGSMDDGILIKVSKLGYERTSAYCSQFLDIIFDYKLQEMPLGDSVLAEIIRCSPTVKFCLEKNFCKVHFPKIKSDVLSAMGISFDLLLTTHITDEVKALINPDIFEEGEISVGTAAGALAGLFKDINIAFSGFEDGAAIFNKVDELLIIEPKEFDSLITELEDSAYSFCWGGYIYSTIGRLLSKEPHLLCKYKYFTYDVHSEKILFSNEESEGSHNIYELVSNLFMVGESLYNNDCRARFSLNGSILWVVEYFLAEDRTTKRSFELDVERVKELFKL